MYYNYEYRRQMSQINQTESFCQAIGGLGAVAFVMGLLFCANPTLNLTYIGLPLFLVGTALTTETVLFMLNYPQIKKLNGIKGWFLGIALIISGILLAIYTSAPSLAYAFIFAFAEIILLIIKGDFWKIFKK